MERKNGFEEFVENVKDRIKDYLPGKYENAVIEVSRHEKINESYLGMCVWTGGNAASPILNLEMYYALCQGGLTGMEDVIRRMADIVQENTIPVDLSLVTDYGRTKENLFIRVCDAGRNGELLKNIPHTRIDDLAVTYHILRSIDAGGMSSMTVTSQMMADLGITKEQLHQDAIENSPRLFPPMIENIGTMLRLFEMKAAGLEEEDISEIRKTMDQDMQIPMLVVTNREQINGASALFYPGILDQVGEMMGEGYFILPSSVHEWIIVPDREGFDANEMQVMIMDANQNAVTPDIQLGDEAYHYDPKEHVFEKASVYEERLKSREKGLETGGKQKRTEPDQKQKDNVIRLSL
ncbi:MAG: DUF5688 family protein [bacterium]|nr:DUF5688 family protein [bacterium]